MLAATLANPRPSLANIQADERNSTGFQWFSGTEHGYVTDMYLFLDISLVQIMDIS